MRLSTLAHLAIATTIVDAYDATHRTFAVNHFYGKGPLMEGRVDPIVNPGAASGHVHTIQGGNAFGLTMSDTQALGSTCTSSLVKNDKSNYWTPKLYFQNTDGTLEDVELFYMNVYYFFEATTDKIQAFPPGLRMLVGNPSLRTPPYTSKSVLDLADGTPQPVQWTCPRSNTNDPLYPTNSDGLHGVGIQDPGNKGAGVGFPDQVCDGYASPLRADIHFPSCYNPDESTGGGLKNFKTNMQFPTNGNCPAGWTHVPHLFYEVYWNTPKKSWTPGQGKQPFVLANGDPTGYSLHADFIAGWDEKTLQQIIDNCDAGDSGMDKCPGLIGGLNDSGDSCNLVSPIQETITGEMSILPGNNVVGQWGVAAAAPVPASSAAAAPASSKVPTSSKAPSTPASSPAAGNSPKPTTTPVVKPTTTPVVKPITTPVVKPTTTPVVKPTTAPAGTTKAPGGAPPNTLVTSYFSETTVVWTTVTAPLPAPTTGSSVLAGWGYYGCYSDTKSGNRVLDGITFANIGNHAVTNTKCVAYCDSKGYSLAGTEYGGQCFCDNALSGSSKVDEAKCNMPCEGDSKETCGGSLTLSVYKKANAKRSVGRHLHAHLHRENSS